MTCVEPNCKSRAAFHVWGDLAAKRGSYCHAHTREIIGCTCARCVEQTAVVRVK